MSQDDSGINLETRVQNAVRLWKDKNLSDTQIKSHVDKMLSKDRDTIILKLLGMDDHWNPGRWELDHCNGRSGESTIETTLRTLVSAQMQAWIIKHCGLPKLTPQQVKVLQAEYLSMYESAVKRKIKEIAEKNAGEYVNTNFREIIKVSDDE